MTSYGVWTDARQQYGNFTAVLLTGFLYVGDLRTDERFGFDFADPAFGRQFADSAYVSASDLNRLDLKRLGLKSPLRKLL